MFREKSLDPSFQDKLNEGYNAMTKNEYSTAYDIFCKHLREYNESNINNFFYESKLLYQKGLALFKLQQYEKALDQFKFNISKNEEHGENHFYYAYSLHKLGASGEALSKINESIRKFRHLVKGYVIKGDIYKEMGNHKEALAQYDLARKKFPDQALPARKYALLREDSFDETIKNFEISSNTLSLFLAYAVRFTKKGNFTSALKILKQLVEVENSPAKAFCSYAFALELSGDIKAANRAYLNAMKLFPNHRITYLAYGLFLQKKLGEVELAESHFKTMIEKFPDFAPGYLGLSISASEQCDLGRAIHLASLAISKKPDYDSAYSQIGHCYKELAKIACNQNNFNKLGTDYFNKAMNIRAERLDKHKINEPDKMVSIVERLDEGTPNASLPGKRSAGVKIADGAVKRHAIEILIKIIKKKAVKTRQEQAFINLWNDACRNDPKKALDKFNSLHQELIKYCKIDEIKEISVTELEQSCIQNRTVVSSFDHVTVPNEEIDEDIDDNSFELQGVSIKLMEEIGTKLADLRKKGVSFDSSIEEAKMSDLFDQGNYKETIEQANLLLNRLTETQHTSLSDNKNSKQPDIIDAVVDNKMTTTHTKKHKPRQRKAKQQDVESLPSSEQATASPVPPRQFPSSSIKACAAFGLFATAVVATGVTIALSMDPSKRFT
jgi:tetratricopeptide (TPR) repeat protein